MIIQNRILFAAAMTMAPLLALAAPLSFVTVSAPEINCVFDTDCKVTVTDTVDTIVVPPAVWTGTARLQSRTFPPGQAGTPGAGKTAYLYRVDLTSAVSEFGEVPCVTDIVIDFGAVSKLQYNASGPTDDVFVITKGGIGTIPLYAVEQNGNNITFIFNQPVCAGPTAGTGKSSYFFGLASAFPPKSIDAHVSVPGMEPIHTKGRGPSHPNIRPGLVLPVAPSGLRAN